MHIPSQFKEVNLDKLHKLIQDFPLGTLITSTDGLLDASHIPFYLEELKCGRVTLQSHVARTNPLWESCANGQEVLLIFHGPNAYVSPNFYPSKKEAGKVVPTWNYSVVHVRGRIYFKHESAWIMKLLSNLSNFHEVSQNSPWSVSDAPADFTQKLVQAVVGLEVVIENIVGNFKLSQNKTETDYLGVLQGLAGSKPHSSRSVSKQMQTLTRS